MENLAISLLKPPPPIGAGWLKNAAIKNKKSNVTGILHCTRHESTRMIMLKIVDVSQELSTGKKRCQIFSLKITVRSLYSLIFSCQFLRLKRDDMSIMKSCFFKYQSIKILVKQS